jgi:hypothetical protein
MPSTAPIPVDVTGVEPFASFAAKVADADRLFSRMTSAETAALPSKASAGMTLVQDALRNLAAATPPDRR